MIGGLDLILPVLSAPAGDTMTIMERVAADVRAAFAVPPRFLQAPRTSSCTAAEVMLRERLAYWQG
jgi:hypothetical protein